jgi:hypothetical protein
VRFAAVSPGIAVVRDDHYGHESIKQRGAASCGHPEETLREAGFSLRTGLRNLGAFVRQNWHARRLPWSKLGFMRQTGGAISDDGSAVKCELAAEVLRSFGSLRFAATGWSMLRSVWPGDTLVVERVRPEQARIGDVVLVRRAGRLCAHRLVFVAEDSGKKRWTTQGDAMSAPDRPVDDSELLGRVAYLIRSGKCIPVPAELSVVENLIARIVRRSLPAARALVYLQRRFQTPEETVLPCQG